MSNRLEQFVRDHREEFDGDEPASKIWEKIQFQLDPGKKHTAPVRSLANYLVRWSAAAAILVLAGVGIWFITRSVSKKNNQSIAINHPTSPLDAKKSESGPVTPPSKSFAVPDQSLTQKGNPELKSIPRKEESLADDESEEMYHYAKLVEIKHKELKKIEKEEPLLYKQFAGDVNKLDFVYHSLQDQLSKNPNHEQLLEAMIQNLQLQMKLLNHQLNIVKQINHTKKSAYENAIKST